MRPVPGVDPGVDPPASSAIFAFTRRNDPTYLIVSLNGGRAEGARPRDEAAEWVQKLATSAVSARKA